MQKSSLQPEALAAPVRPWSGNSRPLRLVRELLPLVLLILLEAVALGQLTAAGKLQLSSVGALLAGLIFCLGLLPAALRPSKTSVTFGCFSVALACLVYLTPQVTSLDLSQLVVPVVGGPRELLLANWLLLAMLGQQMAINFTGLGRLSRKASGAAFAVAGLSLLSVVLLPPGPGRLAAIVVLCAFVLVLMGVTVWLLGRTASLRALGESPQAPAARLVIVSVALAEIPLIAMVLGPWLGIVIPAEVVLGSQAVIPLGVGAAILWRNPFGIDRMVRRAIAFVGLATAILIVNLGLGLALIATLSQVPATFRPLAAIVTLLVGGILYAPLRLVVERALDRMLFPEFALVQREVASAANVLATVAQRDEIVTLLVETLPRRLEAAWSVILPAGDPLPQLPGVERAWSMELTIGGKRLGTYWLGPRSYCPHYSAAEREQLRALGQQAALALAYAETVDDLTTLNRELEDRVQHRTVQVLAQQRELAMNQERQRIARDLHDSVKQSLFSLGLGLRAVRGLLATNPPGALEALREQEQVAMQAQQEMAELLAQLRAHAVPVGNLVEALRGQAALVEQQTGIVVSVEGPLTMAVADARSGEILQIAREALHNVVKHSGARRARICLAMEPGALTLRIADDGCGFDVAHTGYSGHGMRGMAERAAMIGGALAVRATPGEGTTVQLTVPLEDETHG